MLELHRISKTIEGKSVLRDVTLCLAKGEMVCLTGASGIGKTTLLEIAAGIREPDSGTCTRGSTRIGCAFQDTPLLPWRTVLENMDFILSAHGSAAVRRQTALTWLETLGLQDAVEKKPPQISGGMQRRLAIAASLAVAPDILLLDEPFAFLDAHWQAVVADLVRRLNRTRGVTILLVSHQFEPLRGLGAAVVEMRCAPDGAGMLMKQ
jgi:ABC-type nitrate/sulfonate/bicarbonate transport system ATPase subunit